ncbi:MAG TPA: ArdC-like ssDNA-binding domain-containing protein [Phycisphaerae bacterium]|nr:ArdC-like ssDNA-binding domain-containing protein [Phycisphaerae bacterium]
MSRFDLCQTVTDQIVAMLEKGVVPWRHPVLGRGETGWPKNLNTGKGYRGLNVFTLNIAAYCKGYVSSYWLTFNQAKERGGSVKKGEKSSMVIFWKQLAIVDRQTGEPDTVPMLRYYNVFNVDQCEGIAAPDASEYKPTLFSPIENAEAIVKGYDNAPTIEHGGLAPLYRPSLDKVLIPEPTRFVSPEAYYATLFHELAHSTGHFTRLDRKDGMKPTGHETPEYVREELIAEMSAAYLCARAGIQPATIENQAAYIGSWIKVLRGNNRLAVVAAGAAQKAADWITGQHGAAVATEQQPEAIAA